MARNKQGWKCEKKSDGSHDCTRFEKDGKGNKVATGTQIGVSVDDECNPVFSGDVNEIMDADSGAINEIAGRMTQSCKNKKLKGMA